MILLLIRAVVPLRPPVAACYTAVLKCGMHCSALDVCLVQLTQHNKPVHCYGSRMLIHALIKTMIKHADNDNNNSKVDSITTTTMTSIAMVWKNDGKSTLLKNYCDSDSDNTMWSNLAGAILGDESPPASWAAQYDFWLHIKLTLKGIVVSFPFSPHACELGLDFVVGLGVDRDLWAVAVLVQLGLPPLASFGFGCLLQLSFPLLL